MTGWNIKQTRDAEIASFATRGDGTIPFICKRECEMFAISVHRKMSANARQLGLSPAALYSLEDYLLKGGEEMERRILNHIERIERDRLRAEKAKEDEARFKAAFPADPAPGQIKKVERLPPETYGGSPQMQRPGHVLLITLGMLAALSAFICWPFYGPDTIDFLKGLLP